MFQRIFLLFLLLFSSLSLASNKYQAKSLRQGINKIIRKTSQKVHIGVIVRKAGSGKVLYSHHASFLYAPASVQKLFTATAALLYLGPNFHFNTKLMTNGKIVNHVLNGNLAVKFSGDPEFTHENLSELLSKLQELDITRINGKIYVDVSDYDDVPYAPGWMWDDLSYGYAAPLYAAIIDRNKFILRLEPSKKLYHHPTLSIAIPNGILNFKNQVKTTAKYDKHCPLTIYSDLHNDYLLNGCLTRSWGRQRRTLAIRNPMKYAQVLIEKDLQEDGIAFTSRPQVHRINKLYTVLADYQSPPLSDMLKEMLKKSDNLTTDSLLKEIGRKYSNRQGGWQNGLDALKHILAKPTGINFKSNLINDGAGLSRYNLIKPNQLSLLLSFIYTHPVLRKTLIPALPIAGIDGTLIGRMFSEARGERVRAKTGTMTGVTALAGFVYTRHLGVLTFAVMINGFVGKSTPYRRIEDRICKFIAHYQGKAHG